MRGWRGHTRCGKTTAAMGCRRKAATATMGSRRKAAAASTPTASVSLLRDRTGYKRGGNEKANRKRTRVRTHGPDLRISPIPKDA